MNVYQPYRWYDLSAPEHTDRVHLTVHALDHNLGRDIRSLVTDTPAVSAWTYQSPPVAAHNRPTTCPPGVPPTADELPDHRAMTAPGRILLEAARRGGSVRAVVRRAPGNGTCGRYRPV